MSISNSVDIITLLQVERRNGCFLNPISNIFIPSLVSSLPLNLFNSILETFDLEPTYVFMHSFNRYLLSTY